MLQRDRERKRKVGGTRDCEEKQKLKLRKLQNRATPEQKHRATNWDDSYWKEGKSKETYSPQCTQSKTKKTALRFGSSL